MDSHALQYLAVARVDVQLRFSKRVVPDVFHVFPSAHYAVVHRVVDLQHVSELAEFIADHQVLKRRTRRK